MKKGKILQISSTFQFFPADFAGNYCRNSLLSHPIAVIIVKDFSNIRTEEFMSTIDPAVTPILKWVGGKRQLLETIMPLIPEHTTYYEPFVGGGAVLFHTQPGRAVINDSNAELINIYEVIKAQPEELIACLERHKEKNSQEYFYEVRSLDRDREKYETMLPVEQAARIIYLNKTCYNGLFRVNRAGEFNSPWGRYKNPNITNEAAIRAMSRYLNRAKVTVLCGDYREALKGIRKGSFVYLDPPYMPLSTSSSFTGYTAAGFGAEQQKELKKQCDLLNKKGIRFLLSNSCCDFIEDLYKDYIVERVAAKRTINAKADKRGAIDEVLVRNYELDR